MCQLQNSVTMFLFPCPPPPPPSLLTRTQTRSLFVCLFDAFFGLAFPPPPLTTHKHTLSFSLSIPLLHFLPHSSISLCLSHTISLLPSLISFCLYLSCSFLSQAESFFFFIPLYVLLHIPQINAQFFFRQDGRLHSSTKREKDIHA